MLSDITVYSAYCKYVSSMGLWVYLYSWVYPYSQVGTGVGQHLTGWVRDG